MSEQLCSSVEIVGWMKQQVCELEEGAALLGWLVTTIQGGRGVLSINGGLQ